MTRLFTTASATVLALLGGAAMAEGINYLSYGAGYAHLEQDGAADKLDITTLSGSIDYETGPWVLSGALDYLAYKEGGGTDDATFVDATVGYAVTPGFYAMLGYSDILTSSSSDNGLWRLGGEYHTGAYRMGLGYSQANDGDFSATTAYVGYTLSEQTDFAGAVTVDDDGDTQLLLLADHDTGPWSFDGAAVHFFDRDATYYDLNAKYEFAGNYRALGGVSGYAQGGDSITRVGLGAGYELRDDMWIDLTAARYVQSGSGPEINEIGLALTFETGGHKLLANDLIDTERWIASSVIGGAG